MPAVTAAANASFVPNLYIIVGTRAGVVYRYEKGRFPSASTYPIASASKLVASATIQRLVDRGVMRLDDNPQRYLSYWTSSAADQRSRVTLEHLLSFTSGFNTDAYQADLEAAACALRAAFPDTFQNKFKVYDFGLNVF